MSLSKTKEVEDDDDGDTDTNEERDVKECRTARTLKPTRMSRMDF